MLEILIGLVLIALVILIVLQVKQKQTVDSGAIEQILSVADSKFKDSLQMGTQELGKNKELIDKELQTVSKQVKDISGFLAELKSEYKTISTDSLKSNTEQFTHLAQEKLNHFSDSGKEMIQNESIKIDKSLKHTVEQTQKIAESNEKLIDEKRSAISERIVQMENVMQILGKKIDEYEKFNASKFDQLNEQITQASQLTLTLSNTTNNLVNMLKNTKSRGQFGEQIAEDILRFAGLIENVNYVKQIGTEIEGGRPDFKFILPENRAVFMDVKFPLNSYQQMFESNGNADMYQKQFLKDVKTHVTELKKRDYSSSESLDYIIMFIPNEGIFSFINELEPMLVLNALQDKIIVCSPLTLFAVLAIIRQSVNNFKLHETAREIQNLMNDFYSEWKKYNEEIEKTKKQLSTVSKTFETLTSTRSNQLNRKLERIEALKIDESRVPLDISGK